VVVVTFAEVSVVLVVVGFGSAVVVVVADVVVVVAESVVVVVVSDGVPTTIFSQLLSSSRPSGYCTSVFLEPASLI